MNKALFLIFTTLTFYSISQVKLSKDFTVEAGKPYPVIDALSKQYFSFGNNKSISIKTEEESVTIQIFDASTMTEESRTIYKDLPKDFRLQRIIQSKNTLYYMYAELNKSDKTYSLFSREIDINKGTFETAKKLFTTTRPITMCNKDIDGKTPVSEIPNPFNMNNGSVQFDVFQSFDKSKVLIQYRVKPVEKSDSKNKDIIGFYVFDDKMEEIWGKETTMPHTEKEINNLAYTVDSEGNAYAMVYLNEQKKFELLKFQKSSDIEVYPLNINGDLVFQRFNLLEDLNGNIMCAGYYATGIEYHMKTDMKLNYGSTQVFNTNGIYCFKMNTKGEVSDLWDFEFPLELIQQYNSEKQQEKNAKKEALGKAGIPDLKMVEFFTQDDGSYIIIGEQQFRLITTGFNSALNPNPSVGVGSAMKTTTSDEFTFGYEDIIITKISSEGEIVWQKRLPKKQVGSSGSNANPYFEGQMSFKYAEGQDSHYLLFIDNPKNSDLTLNQDPFVHQNGRGGYLTAFRLSDTDGTVERHTVADLLDLDGIKAYQFKVTRINNVADKTFLLEVYKKDKEDAMIKITLND